jgi:AcrR family transcriptional regulator
VSAVPDIPDLPDDDADSDDEEPRASDGRVPGRRGKATRQRLLDCTLRMLEHNSYRDLKVVDIAREAGTSPATFYQYFPDVEEAILALAEEMASEGNDRLIALVRTSTWRGAPGYATARQIADSYIGFYDDNWPLMRVIDLTSEEGDQRFRSIRTRLLNEFTVALSEVIAAEKKAGRHPDEVDPMATAGVLVSMLAHVASHRYGFEFYGIRTEELTRSMARIVFTTVSGQRPPKAG